MVFLANSCWETQTWNKLRCSSFIRVAAYTHHSDHFIVMETIINVHDRKWIKPLYMHTLCTIASSIVLSVQLFLQWNRFSFIMLLKLVPKFWNCSDTIFDRIYVMHAIHPILTMLPLKLDYKSTNICIVDTQSPMKYFLTPLQFLNCNLETFAKVTQMTEIICLSSKKK